MKNIISKIFLIIFTLPALCNFKCLSPGLPESDKILFFRNNKDIYMADINGKNEKQITFDGGAKTSFSVSSDRSKILYTLDYPWPGGSDLYIMNLDGSNNKLIPPGVDGKNATFSNDGNKIAFVKIYNTNWHIYLMDSDGSNLKRLTSVGVHTYTSFVNSNKIVYTWYNGSDQDIYIMDIDGKNVKQLTNNSDPDMLPTVSPDGRKIAYVVDTAGDYNVYIMDIDGRNKKQLTFYIGNDTYPSFSSDGSKIVFQRNANEIYIMNVDGSNKTKIIDNGTKPCFLGSPR